MNVSTSSWHYRLVDGLGWVHRKSLCLYFWQVVFAMLIAIALAILIPVSLLIVVVFVPACVGKLIYSFFDIAAPASNLVRITYFTLTGYGLFLLVFVVALFELWLRQKNKSAPKKPDGLLASYIKTKKQKICPVINFEDKK